MNAVEFVKHHGIEYTKGIIIGCESGLLPKNNNYAYLKQIVDAFELVEKVGGLERVKKAIDGKHIGYTHFYLHSNGRYVFLDNYMDFIPDHAHHIGLFNKAINLVDQCNA